MVLMEEQKKSFITNNINIIIVIYHIFTQS